jgi:glycolate oxidase iron-sulfur subunit
MPSPTLDTQHPPEAKLIDACVHCGFCLSTCPSYRVLGTEMDSPRGRVYMMDALNQGEIELTPTVVSHFDSCLGCLACTTTCPSGVQYDKLITSMRSQIARNHPRPLVERLYRQFIFGLFPYPNRLRLLLIPLFVYQKLGLQKLVRQTGIVEKVSPHLAGMESNLPELSLSTFQDTIPELVPAQGTQRYRVGMILGCVQRLFFDRVNQATVRVLTANGCEIVIPQSQGCCAALPHHQGEEEQAKTLARQMIDTFADTHVDAIIINAAGCGHTLKEYGELLKDDPEYVQKAIDFSAKVKDVQEFLAEIKLTTPLSPISTDKLTLVYQDACHLLHGQKISVQPRQLLKQIPNITLTEPLDAALCCGSAGVYNMLQPDTANELGRQKVNNLVNTGATIIASANPGCTLQIVKHLELQGHQTKILHPIELLDLSIRGIKLEDS